jgi:hypothetical protein
MEKRQLTFVGLERRDQFFIFDRFKSIEVLERVFKKFFLN